ncbi:DUF6232 family protein [Kitasatospora cathayae]|uniref:DUF6232 family protein n=1 Tax=Kitasatospora cathayae TaxID=3004092 RepID=A0ABY7QB19_9ACTN|nr:DUF6232 family protein [Kitasatospora sp. HUAS 3-15]WBP89629.1 DUF6232 family protein [Kitasatospora sp. HUAS 3-15]
MARSVIDVRVSRRVLWIGGDAYPLNQIARARQVVWWPPKRSRLIIRFVRKLLGLLIIAGVLNALVPGMLTRPGSAYLPDALLLGFFCYYLYRLVTQLRYKPLYKLVIETSSSSNTAVVSYQAWQVQDLIQRIMEAIDDPLAEFTIQVENVHIGDQINQYGDHNTGKTVYS